MPDEIFVITLVITSLTGILAFTGMIIRAVNRNLDRRAALEDQDDERVELLEERLALLHEHVQQLEERVEFTERVVARDSATGKLPEGAG